MLSLGKNTHILYRYPARQNQCKMSGKLAENRQKIGGIRKLAVEKTVDEVPCLSFSAQIPHQYL